MNNLDKEDLAFWRANDSFIDYMCKKSIPLTRANYLIEICGTEYPADWDFELEGGLPEFLQAPSKVPTTQDY